MIRERLDDGHSKRTRGLPLSTRVRMFTIKSTSRFSSEANYTLKLGSPLFSMLCV